ncbi:MAG: MBL fold metallo-hydrolase [Cellvibrionaceae bacterium]
MTESPYKEVGFGITCIDTGLGRKELAACYLMEEDNHLAIIETGTGQSVPTIMNLIKNKGYKPEQVDYVIITHVHLDHAGGASELMQILPNAKLVVHPYGARHMIDPSRLQAGAMAVYGEKKYYEQYGDLVPISENRMIIADDNFELLLANRKLVFLDTPGHARHHFCVYDQQSEGIFTGDTMGIVYRELSEGFGHFVMPSTTPVQFDPEAMKSSIDRMMTLQPKRFFLTHYGMVENTKEHSSVLKRKVDEYVDFGNRYKDDPERKITLSEKLLTFTLDQLKHHGSPLSLDEQKEVLFMDVNLNAQGINVWLDQNNK